MIKCFLILNITSTQLMVVRLFMKKITKKNKFLSDDDIPLNKMIYFPTATVIIRCIFEQNRMYYPQVYLDDCLYQV